MSNGLELLTNAEMALADRLAVAAGVPSLVLMENAGRAVADEAAKLVGPGARISVLCGPGNNGGDGFVAARHLALRGYRPRVHLLGARDALEGDAARMAVRWTGPCDLLEAFDGRACALVIDALFGSGLTRPIEGIAARIVGIANGAGVPILAVDVPSGLDGDSGAAEGPAIRAARTITFFRRKPGHLLLDGRGRCGQVDVAGIGVPDGVLDGIRPTTFANAPGLWRGQLAAPSADAHKYTRGHAVVVSGGPETTGAARLGARGALRVGAGLVTVASPRAAFPVNAAHLTAIMVRPIDVPDGLERMLEDKRLNAVLVGPGGGVGSATVQLAAIAARSGASVVLDADALTSFAARLDALADLCSAAPGRVVLTPHDGEFQRLFPNLPGSRLDRARAAADRSGAVVVLKGPDTVIAAPDGRAAINENAPPWLATAGSGDVLAGFVTGLLAQGMAVWEAACAAVWLHGECASRFGPGLIAEDLPEQLPHVLERLQAASPGG